MLFDGLQIVLGAQGMDGTAGDGTKESLVSSTDLVNSPVAESLACAERYLCGSRPFPVTNGSPVTEWESPGV